MARKVDPEIVADFVVEAKGYLPHIEAGISAFGNDQSKPEILEEAYRHLHNIHGSASMVGLVTLSHMAHQLEMVLEDLSAGTAPLQDQTIVHLNQGVAHLRGFLEAEFLTPEQEASSLLAVLTLGRSLRALSIDEVTLEAEFNNLFRHRPGTTASVLESEWKSNDSPPSGVLLPWIDAGQDNAPPEALFGDLHATPEGLNSSSRTIRETQQENALEPGPEVSPELLEVFALEAEDHLHKISNLLPDLDKNPENSESLQEIRRSAHTLKGAAAMVGFENITHLAHRMEDLLDQLYEGRRAVTAEIIHLLLDSNDLLEDLATGKQETLRLQALYARYSELLPEEPTFPIIQVSNSPGDGELFPAAEPSAANADFPNAPALGARRYESFVRVPIERLDELVKLVGELVINRTTLEQRLGELVSQAEELRPSTERLRNLSYQLETGWEASALAGQRGIAPRPEKPGPLNRLLSNFHGHGFDDLQFDRYTEFHLVSRGLAETTSDVQSTTTELGHRLGELEGTLTRQARLTGEIEDKLMRLRMVPLASLAARLQRTVRNVADQQAKQVDLVLEGEATELDKTVLEEMSDPLMHILRNAVDHGIESPETRLALGKPDRGTICIKAFHEGHHVVIEVTDDGAGLDSDSIRQTAVNRGMYTASQAAALSDGELHALVFRPGFSTASSINEISGRGVGLDIVRVQVNRLKGALSLSSRPGKGATFTIRLPLTLGITRALLVKAHQETFAIPLEAVRFIQRLDQSELDVLGKDPVARLGGQVYPLVFLGKALALKQPADASVTRPPVLILNAGGTDIALAVDHIVGGREIVIKNLGAHLRNVSGVAGATLMGDGSVVLIVNPAELVSNNWVRPAVPQKRASQSAEKLPGESWKILIVEDSPSVRRIVGTLISRAGWTPHFAKDGLEALELLHQADFLPDLVLLDVEMPRMDGYELLSTLRGQDMYRDLPVVMVTSRAGDKHRNKALALGASGYIVKPYQDEAMLSAIRQLVRASRQNLTST